jgi:hypothetical protein
MNVFKERDKIEVRYKLTSISSFTGYMPPRNVAGQLFFAFHKKLRYKSITKGKKTN